MPVVDRNEVEIWELGAFDEDRYFDVTVEYAKASPEDILIQALLDAPLFGVRWRWNATRSLAVPRFRGGAKIAAPLQRMESENLLAAVFPDQLACLEHIVGDREIPDHPLVRSYERGMVTLTRAGGVSTAPILTLSVRIAIAAMTTQGSYVSIFPTQIPSQ